MRINLYLQLKYIGKQPKYCNFLAIITTEAPASDNYRSVGFTCGPKIHDISCVSHSKNTTSATATTNGTILTNGTVQNGRSTTCFKVKLSKQVQHAITTNYLINLSTIRTIRIKRNTADSDTEVRKCAAVSK